MSIELLAGDPVDHGYQHDLESFFYVFLWICTFYTKPGVLIAAKDAKDKPMYLWGKREWTHKEVHMRRFDRLVLHHFTEYFEDFKGLAQALYNVMFPREDVFASHSSVTHKSFISILEAKIAELKSKPEQAVTSPSPVSTPSETEVPYHVGFAKRMLDSSISLPTEGWHSEPSSRKRVRLD
jgi:hypothetical protein